RMCAPPDGRYRRRTWPRSIGSPCKTRYCREQPSPPTTAMDSCVPSPLASARVRGRARSLALEGEGRNSTRPAFAAAQISSKVCKVCPNSRFVDRIGVEVGVIPFDHALVVKMSGVRDRLQEGLVAGRSADIRRRTTALGTDEARIIDVGRRSL